MSPSSLHPEFLGKDNPLSKSARRRAGRLGGSHRPNKSKPKALTWSPRPSGPHSSGQTRTSPSFEIIFLDITGRGKGWAHAGVTLTVDLPPGLAWAVTRREIPEGPSSSHLWASAPRKPAKMMTELRQGVLFQRKETLTFQAKDGVHSEGQGQ